MVPAVLNSNLRFSSFAILSKVALVLADLRSIVPPFELLIVRPPPDNAPCA